MRSKTNNIISAAGALALAVALFSCGPEHTESASLKKQLIGNWLSKPYIDSLSIYKSIKRMRYSAEEIIFRPQDDSMMVIQVGLELFVLKYDSIGPRTIRINKYNQDEHTDFVLSEDGSTLEYEYKKFKEKYTFAKMPEIYARETLDPGWNAASTFYINHALIAGEYDLLDGNSRPTHKQVNFNVNGSIQGFGAYTGYDICTGGDCIDMCTEDLIEMQSGEQGDELHWQFHGDTLLLFHVSQINPPDEFPVLVPDTLLLKLLKEE